MLALPVPNCQSYDPAFAYELAVIVEDGLKRMYRDQEDIFYYLTVMNEQYAMPPMPEGAKDGILRGLYKLKSADAKASKLQAQILGSGAIIGEAVKAQAILGEKYGVAADGGASELHGLYLTARRRAEHGTGRDRRCSKSQDDGNQPGVFVAASDYMKIMPSGIDRWLPRPMHLLGTDGFGRSESRADLRDFFEVDARFIVFATLTALLKDKKIDAKVVQLAMKDLGINPDKKNRQSRTPMPTEFKIPTWRRHQGRRSLNVLVKSATPSQDRRRERGRQGDDRRPSSIAGTVERSRSRAATRSRRPGSADVNEASSCRKRFD